MEQVTEAEQYQVFISHRGPDTKNNVASLIYHNLKPYGLRVFLDKEELRTGMALSPAIRGAISSASVHLVIFSQNYAHSRWCLDELRWMLRSSHERKFIPIFCDVEPWELRHTERGCYADAFHKHQQDGRVSPEVVEGWKEALREAAEITGLQFKSKESDYGEFVREIENVVTKQVKWDPLEVATHPVGLDQALKDLDDHIQKQRSTKVVGIAGGNGIGKSTLAKHMFNLRRSKFSRASYLFNVREKVDLTYLQRQLFRDLLGKDMDIPNTDIGRTILRNSLKGLKILIVLDGVDDSEKIKCLLDMNAVEAGSLIFITSCDKDILRGSFKNTLLYDVKPLKQSHVRELFCRHAFHQSNPFEGYEESVEGFLKICGGLPLCLKVFGEQLAGKLDRKYWKRQLEKFSRGQQLMEADTVINALKWSYKAMEMEQQEMLLDVGCFFVGEDVELAVRVLEGLGYHNDVRDCLESLRQKCLLDFNNDVESQNDIEILNAGRHLRLPPVLHQRSSKIIMQNQVRELARRIARQDLRTTDKPLRLSLAIEIEKMLQLQVCRSIGNFTCGIFSEMSKDNHGKKPSRQTDVLSYFQKAPSKNTHPLHDSSSFEQSVTEREVNSCGNAFDIHTMDEEIGSSSGQGEINAVSTEIGDENVKDFSLESDTIHSRKRKRGQWAIGRRFQENWVSSFPFIEEIPPTNEKELFRQVRCIACSWKTQKEVKFQMKLDTVQKHAGKVYEKKIVNGKEKSIVRWKSSEECRHVEYAEEYKKYLLCKRKLEADGGPIISLFEKTMERNLLSKTIQLSTVFHILSKGRPMTDYPDHRKLLSFLQVPNFPSSHWSVTSGWGWAGYLAQVEKDDLKEKIANARFLALSLDEVTAIDNTSWICMSIYMVNDHIRHSYLLGINKMRETSTAENIYELVLNGLKESGMDELMIAKKLVCVGADGAAVMQGQRNGLCVRLQLSASPYMLNIHCMAHRMNFAFKIVSKFPSVSNVEDLVRETHAYFSRSPKRYLEFQQFADGITDGKKLLKDVDTRWISLNGPAQRLFSEFKSLVGLMYENRYNVDKAQDLLSQLTNIETLLTLAGILPMLHEMNVLVKMSQNRTMYIAEYTNARKSACLALDNLYMMPDSFTGPEFKSWTEIINIENTENFLTFDEKGILCIVVRGYMVPFHYINKTGRITKDCPVSRDQFDNIVISVRQNLIEIARSLSLEIRERFPRDEFLEAMCVVYPQYWNNCQCRRTLKADFQKRLKCLVDHFCKKVWIHGEQIEGILDSSKLYQQGGRFAETMWKQYLFLENPNENGAITRLWTTLSASQYPQENISEYFKLADLCQTMILGSVEDERMFSALSFLKSKLRNKLDKHVDTCLRLYVTKYDIDSFPYERALTLWRSDCDGRGENNIINLSNELDIKHNVLEAHNDSSFREDYVHNLENEDQDENWEIEIP